MTGLRDLKLTALVLSILCVAPQHAAWAHGMIVSYRGAQEQYVPCVFLADGLDDLAPPGLGAGLGCVGRNIVAKVKRDGELDFLRMIPRDLQPDHYGVMILVLDKGREVGRVTMHTSDALAFLKPIMAGFPDVQETFQQRFVQVLQRPVAQEGPSSVREVQRHGFTDRQLTVLERQAQKGDANAALQLAESGQFHPDSEMNWWRLAATNGSARAQYRYAMILGSLGGEDNLREAIRWMEQAAKNRAEGADEALENLRRRLQTQTP